MVDYFPSLAFQSLSIISKTLSEEKYQKTFLRLLPKDHKEKSLLRNGLVRCLEYSDVDSDELKSRMRQIVLWLLTKCVQSNIGHFLCGFNRQDQLEPIDFYLTLTGRSSRVTNCFQAILTFLDEFSAQQIDFYPKSLPLCYEIIYLLVTNSSNSIVKIVFENLHEHFFLQKQIQNFLPMKTTTSTFVQNACETFLLRLIAHELYHLTCEATVISKNLLQTTLNLLFELIEMKTNRLTATFLHRSVENRCEENFFENFKSSNIDLNKIQQILDACRFADRPD